jgi:protein LSM14
MNKNERPGVPQQPPPMPSGGMGYIPSPGAPPPSSNPPLPGYAHKQQEGAYGTPPALQQGPPTTVTKTPPKAEPSTAPAKPADAPPKQEAKNNTPVSFPGVDPSLQATKNKDVPSSTTTTFTKDEEVRKDRQEQDARPRRGGRQGGQYNGEGERGGERNDRGNRRGGNSNRRGRGRGRGGFADRPSDRFLKEEAIPTADFDFASSNAKFSKVDLVKEFGQLSVGEDTPPARAPQQQPQHQPDEFYSKTKGFFDDISCDAKERYEQQQEGKLSLNERRARLQHERKTNMETFGKSSAEGASYRGGARGRPYRGRGGNGGQQRGGNNNTNNNTNNGRPVSPQNGGNYNGGGGRGGYGRGNRRGGRPPR